MSTQKGEPKNRSDVAPQVLSQTGGQTPNPNRVKSQSQSNNSGKKSSKQLANQQQKLVEEPINPRNTNGAISNKGNRGSNRSNRQGTSLA